MRTLHFGLRVANPGRALAFYARYEVVGTVPGTSRGDLTMIKLAGDALVATALRLLRERAWAR
jgi:lactoylglutathione lyase